MTDEPDDGTDTDDSGERTNCPDCGARNDVDAGTCHHCGSELPDPL